MVEQAAANSSRQNRTIAPNLTTLIVGLLLGAGLGPALFLTAERLELRGDQLLSFAVGVFLTLAVCLIIAGVAAVLLVPRAFASARGTLSGVVEDLVRASRAHAAGQPTEAVDHLGRAIGEGVAWYSIGATRRFVAQAALGLILSFGGIIGAVLLLSQNALLREQNGMVKSQLKLLEDQNGKIDRQLELLVDQNEKIDQQTMTTDSQKRGAFATELFSIIQAIAREGVSDGGRLSNEIVSRIVVLTSSAEPYFYLKFSPDPPSTDADKIRGAQKLIPDPLSPERGQIILALVRMKVDLKLLSKAGAQFDSADLQGAQLNDVDLSGLSLRNCNFRFATLQKATFNGTNLDNAVFIGAQIEGAEFKSAHAKDADFSNSRMSRVAFIDSNLFRSKFEWVLGKDVKFANTEIGASDFAEAHFEDLSFREVSVTMSLPGGIPWKEEILNAYSQWNVTKDSSYDPFTIVGATFSPLTPTGPVRKSK